MGKIVSRYQVQERGIISPLQLSYLAITVVIATADVFLPAFVAQESGRDSWIAVIIGTIFTLFAVAVFLALGMKYPDKTIIQYSDEILGKWLGKGVGLIYVYYYIVIAAVSTRELGELFVISFNPFAPIAVYNIITMAVAAYAVMKGIEVIARVNEVLLPTGLFVLIFIALVNIPNMNFKNFLPILADGIYPSVKGGILIQGWLLEVIVVLQLIPFSSEKQKLKKLISASVVLLGLGLQIGVLTIAVFGPLTGKFLFPALEYVRYAALGEYLENLDIIIMGVWITGIFIKIAVFYYAAVHGISQLVGFKSYKPVVVPVGILLATISIVAVKRLIQFIHYLHYIFPLYSFVIGFAIPFILLVISAVRSRVKKGKSVHKE
ncbi:MAG: spore germination protein [Clostridia bacterium]|nr:spore germination protein [Clostridia bacterium]